MATLKILKFINEPSKQLANYNEVSMNCKKYIKNHHSEKEFLLKLEKFI